MLASAVHWILVGAVGAGVLASLALLFALPATPRLSRDGAGPPPPRWPRVSIIIPARDEERGVEDAVASHLAQDYPDFEVIVVDDRSSDATPAILERLAMGDSRLRVVKGVDPPEGWLGKPHALHQGTIRATGEIFLLADADIRYAPTALRAGVTLLEARRLDLIAFFPRLEMIGFWENVLMPYLPASYFFGPAFLVNSDSQKLLAAGGGTGMLVRGSAYRASGGHEALRNSMIDDLHLATRVRRSGGRCRMVLADDLVAVRMYHGFSEVVDGFTKNLAYVFSGWAAIPLFLTTCLLSAISIAPVALLAAAGLGAPVAHVDLVLAAVALGLGIVLRCGLAAILGYPQWASLTQPLMAAVWLGIAARSLAWRFVRREVLWRGRRYDAARARF